MPRTRNEEARPRLLSAGLSLFAKLGCERVNTNSIARMAKVGIGTFYSHFEDKYALLQEIQVKTLEGLREARLRELRRAGSAPAEQARAAIAGAVEFARRHPEAYRVTFGRERTSASRQRPVVTESVRPAVNALTRLQRAGRLAPELNPELAARAFASMEVGTILWWIDDPKPCAAADLVETLVQLHPVRGLLLPAQTAGQGGRGAATIGTAASGRAVARTAAPAAPAATTPQTTPTTVTGQGAHGDVR